MSDDKNTPITSQVHGVDAFDERQQNAVADNKAVRSIKHQYEDVLVLEQLYQLRLELFRCNNNQRNAEFVIHADIQGGAV